MASPMKVSILIGVDASNAISGAAAVKTAIDGLGKTANKAAGDVGQLAPAATSLTAIGAAANQASAGMQKLVAAQSGLAGAASGLDVRAADIADYGRALDNLRAKFNPLYNTIRQYKSSISEIRDAHKVGAISTNEMTAAITRERQATLSSIDAIKGRNTAMGAQPTAGPMRGQAANNNFQTANIAAQFQDIGVTAAMGMNPIQIALQQGTQLSAVISSMENPIKGLGAAFMSVVSPVSLITIGVVAAGVAVAQYFMNSGKQAKTTDELLKDHEAAIRRVRDVWGEAANQRSQYGRESTQSASFGLETTISEMTKKMVGANSPTTFGPGAIGEAVTNAVSQNRELSGIGVREFRETPIFKTLRIDFAELQKATLAGKPDVLGLIRSIEEAGRNSGNAGIKSMASDAVVALRPFKELAEALREAELEKIRLFDTVGPNGMLLSQGLAAKADMGNFDQYQSQQKIALERERKAFDAQQKAALAKSPQEKGAAAEDVARTQYNPSEGVTERGQRIALAGLQAQTTAENELKLAQEGRANSLDGSIAAQKLELALVGKSASEQERLRMEQKLTSEIAEWAAKNNIKDTTAEIALMKQKVAEYSKLTKAIEDANAKKTLSRDRLIFDAEQQTATARSPEEKAAAARATAKANSQGGNAEVEAQRVDLAGQRALITARQQLTQAQDDRARSLNASLAAQQEELKLIGLSASEQERLRMEYKLTAELKEQAAKNGIAVDQKELDLIKQKAAEIARVNQAISAQNILQDQDKSIAGLELERSLIGASADERARAVAAMEAEQKIRESGIDTMSREAQTIRDNATQIANAKLQIDQMSAAWGQAQQAGMTAIDTMVAGIGDLDADWKDIGKNALTGVLDTFKELSIANPLKNAVYGSNLPTTSSMGGPGGFLGALMGKKPELPGATPLTSTAAMTVSAGVVNVNGGAGLPGLPGTTPATPPIGGLPAPTGDQAAYREAIAAIESGGNYGALGPTTKNGDRAYGKYQVMGNNIGPWSEEALGKRMTSQEFLANPAAQDAIFDHQFGKSVSKYGNPQDAASVWFTGRPQATGGGASDVLGTTGNQYVSKFNSSLAKVNAGGGSLGQGSSGAEQALTKLAANTNTAASSLTSLDSGVSETAKALTSGSGSLTQSAGALATQTAELPAQSQGLFSTLTSSLSKGVSGIAGGIGGIFSKLLGGLFADGAAFTGGNVTAFAAGGVVSAPTLFPMSGGRMGLMGEAGAEAIMPLKRGRDGKLGVTMAYPQAGKATRGDSDYGRTQNTNMTMSSNIVVSGNGDKELMDRVHRAVDQKINDFGRDFSQSVLPRRMKEIRSDPNAIG